MRPILTVLAVSAVAFGVVACAEVNPETNRAPGTYHSKSESTNAAGTKVSTDKTTHVYRDSSGDKKAVVKTETTRDPEGLFNKEKSTTYKKYE